MTNKAKLHVLIIISLLSFEITAQEPIDFGFRHLQYQIDGEQVDVLVKSKKGEENITKPIYFAVQGSLAVPLIVHDGRNRVIYTALEEGFIEDEFHLVLVNKPGIPLIAHTDSLVDGREYFLDKENYVYSEKYLKCNYLDFYVKRNVQIIDSLFQYDWVDTSMLVVSGHSQGSGIALSMCDKTSKATHLIYSSGLPYYSTIMAMLNRARMAEGNVPNPQVEKIFNYWKETVKEPLSYENKNGDSNMTLASFSKSENDVLKGLNIPVLISYGTKDESCPYQDMFRIETIRNRVKHITFMAYVGLGHNYQLVSQDTTIQKTDFLSDVVNDWLNWIYSNY